MWNWTAASTVFPTSANMTQNGRSFLQSRGIKTLRFWNSHLRRNAQSIRDTIFNELQRRAPHPLPKYTRPWNLWKDWLKYSP